MSVRLCVAALLILTWVAIVVMTLTRNPSKGEAEARLLLMNEDMNLALQVGGKIDSKYINSKNGGSIIIVNIRAESWSLDLAREYQKILLSRGWIYKFEVGGFRLCKDGALAEISLTKGSDASRGISRSVYGFTMTYDATTKNYCA